jgi:hypothetical protein
VPGTEQERADERGRDAVLRGVPLPQRSLARVAHVVVPLAPPWFFSQAARQTRSRPIFVPFAMFASICLSNRWRPISWPNVWRS